MGQETSHIVQASCPQSTADGPSWREVVRKEAHEAAVRETEVRQQGREVLYNYRWEHVQSVVRVAVRLAEMLGADLNVVEAAAWLQRRR